MIQLTAGPMACEIVPQLGGCVAGLWHGGVPVLRSTPGAALTTVRLAGSYPLVPFSNRVAHATLKWQGTAHPLVQNHASEPHAIHGVGWQRPWQVLQADGHSALLAYEHRADAAWPFAFDSSQAFRLTEAGLEQTLSITNQAAQPTPVGLGWHPYFAKRPASRLTFSAGGRWEMGPDKLPTGRSPSAGLDVACASLDVDHCFDGWDGVVDLRDEQLHTRVCSGLSRLVVFTNEARDFVAIEPVSHVNNALNLLDSGRGSAADLGVRVLQPGESVTVQMSIETQAAA